MGLRPTHMDENLFESIRCRISGAWDGTKAPSGRSPIGSVVWSGRICMGGDLSSTAANLVPQYERDAPRTWHEPSAD